MRALFSIIEHYIPRFSNFSKQKKLDDILTGIKIDNESITIAVQNFILHNESYDAVTEYAVLERIGARGRCR